MSEVNPDQVIFDAIVAAIHLSEKRSVTINVKKFIETFNNHRDRKLCVSLSGEPVAWLTKGGACTSDKRSAEIWRDVYRQEIEPLFRVELAASISRSDGPVRPVSEQETPGTLNPAYTSRQPIAAALARRLCQMFDSGGESQRSVRARHASAIFQLLMSETPEQFAECEKCDADPVGYLEAAESAALSSTQHLPPPLQASQNSAERLRNGDAAVGGGEAFNNHRDRKLCTSLTPVPMLPCPVCGGEAIHAIDTLKRVIIRE